MSGCCKPLFVLEAAYHWNPAGVGFLKGNRLCPLIRVGTPPRVTVVGSSVRGSKYSMVNLMSAVLERYWTI